MGRIQCSSGTGQWREEKEEAHQDSGKDTSDDLEAKIEAARGTADEKVNPRLTF